MESGEKYWGLVEPVWDSIDIYDGAEAFLETYRRAPLNSALLFAAHFCQSEVCNGGFRQFFDNSTGVLAPEAAEGFRAIGQEEIAKIVFQAMGCFRPEYERNRAARRQFLASLAEDYFYPLDEKFFSLIRTENGGFEIAADRYAEGFQTGE